MSYAKMVRWHKKHPKGTRQPVLMSTQSGFWASASWVANDWTPYVEACRKIETEPFECQAFYNGCLRGCMMSGLTHDERAQYTKLRRAAGKNSSKD